MSIHSGRLLWLMEHYRGSGDGRFNGALVWRLRGDLRTAALERALGTISGQQEALRTTRPVRSRRWRTADDEHVFCLTMHHRHRSGRGQRRERGAAARPPHGTFRIARGGDG
ncbi:hypothetical protein GCM10009681_42470 [Luedemannella helvata]|uniref:Uncharacterized protein n=1 Tax=Luedemannella helvata TaxID=349315 RepID=A0ABP4X387_9ACTN